LNLFGYCLLLSGAFRAYVNTVSGSLANDSNSMYNIRVYKAGPNKGTTLVWAGRDLNPRTPPCQGNFDSVFWEQYKKFLYNSLSKDTASDRMLYARKYFYILSGENVCELLTLNGEKRNHVMKSLAILSKYLGCYDKWKQIRERHQLKWSNDDSFRSFNHIMDNKTNYSSMVIWLKNAFHALPKDYGNILLYCTLTGLRPDEACKSIKLIHDDLDKYMNKKSMTLEHFRYPDIFIRRTKKAYISIITKGIIEIATNSGSHSYDAIKRMMWKRNLDMNMSFCRKIYATYLRMNRIEPETIDILQGRIGKSLFVKHYYRPDSNNDRIRNILDRLSRTILN
jgi:hypothetical protein